MTTLQPSWLSSLNMVSSTKPNLLSFTNFVIASPMKLACSVNNYGNAQSPEPSSENTQEMPERVRIAFAKAREYKKSLSLRPSSKIEQREKEDSNGNDGSDSSRTHEGNRPEEVPLSVKIAMEKAREYKKNKGLVGGGKMDGGIGSTQDDSKRGSQSAGSLPISDPFPGVNFPEVEFIAGDVSKFDNVATEKAENTQEDSSDVYEPKVSTWGIFPRPSNISKAYGGGRTIVPGEALETEEERAAKEARTKELIAAYKKKIGLKIDLELKSECEEALRVGDSLMDVGKLKEALPYYEKVMNKLDFPSELYGLAALNWAISLDSLGRSNEAEVMYKKLQLHPNRQVNRRARHFAFSFQAMEMMKVSSSPPPLKNLGYAKYFDAFVEKSYPALKGDEDGEVSRMNQALPYIIFLVFPIFMVLIISVQKRM